MKRYFVFLMLAVAMTFACAGSVLAQGNATPRKVLSIPGSCDPTGTKGDVILWKITTPNSGLWTCDPATKVFVFQTNTFAASLTAKTLIYSNAAAAVVSTTAPTNGQLLIGDTGNVPALGTLTGTTNETLITNAAHSITIGLAATVKHKAASFFQLTDSTDTTKVAILDLSNITTATTRTINVPDANSTTVQGGSAVSNQFVTAVSTQGVVNRAQPTEADLSTSDITTNNVTSTKHGLAPKSPADATMFLNGAATPAFAAVKESDLATTDVTTNNVTSTKHGLAPKSPADATKYLNGAATPAFAAVNTTDLATAVSGPLAGNGSGVGLATNTQAEAVKFCSDAGASDTYACNLAPAVASYVTGTHYRFLANTVNTGAATINFNSLGAKTIKKVISTGVTTDLADADIPAGRWVDLVYDGTNMQLQNAPATLARTDAGNAFLGNQTVAVGQTTSAQTDLLINPTTKASGNLIDAQVNSSSKFKVDFNGALTTTSGLFNGFISATGTGSAGASKLQLTWNGGNGTITSYGIDNSTVGAQCRGGLSANGFVGDNFELLSKVGNLKIGSSCADTARGTTEGTNQVVLFNGTAPVGTLTNGASFYAASGEMRVMDSGGNSTLLSPHDHRTNEYIFFSCSSVTGKCLRIEMERMLRALDKKLGGGYVHEFMSEAAARPDLQAGRQYASIGVKAKSRTRRRPSRTRKIIWR